MAVAKLSTFQWNNATTKEILQTDEYNTGNAQLTVGVCNRGADWPLTLQQNISFCNKRQNKPVTMLATGLFIMFLFIVS